MFTSKTHEIMLKHGIILSLKKNRYIKMRFIIYKIECRFMINFDILIEMILRTMFYIYMCKSHTHTHTHTHTHIYIYTHTQLYYIIYNNLFPSNCNHYSDNYLRRHFFFVVVVVVVFD